MECKACLRRDRDKDKGRDTLARAAAQGSFISDTGCHGVHYTRNIKSGTRRDETREKNPPTSGRTNQRKQSSPRRLVFFSRMMHRCENNIGGGGWVGNHAHWHSSGTFYVTTGSPPKAIHSPPSLYAALSAFTSCRT